MRLSIFSSSRTRKRVAGVAFVAEQVRQRHEVRNPPFIGRYLIALLSFLLSSCYATSSSLDLRENAPVPAGEVVVFGRVNVILDNVPVTWKFTFMGRQEPGMFRILIQADATSRVVSKGLTDNGFFVWHLPPGDYTIVGFNYHVGTSGRIMARFTVPPGTPLLYIGTLEIMTRGYVSYWMRIVNDFDEANRELKTRFPEVRGEAVRSLMKLEAPH